MVYALVPTYVFVVRHVSYIWLLSVLIKSAYASCLLVGHQEVETDDNPSEFWLVVESDEKEKKAKTGKKEKKEKRRRR